MKNYHKFVLLTAIPTALFACHIQADQTPAFISDATATLESRTYFFSRDFSDIVGPSTQSKAQETAQGFIFNFASGYTSGPVGLGADVIATAGIKLDSSPDRANTGLLYTDSDGHVPNEYARLAGALRLKLAETVLRIGELQPNLPVLAFSDIRLLPPSYQGASLISKDINNLTLQAGQLRSTSLREDPGRTDMLAMVGFVPNRTADTDRFEYAGADYAFTNNRTTVSLWYAQLKDIYNQRFFGLKHNEPVGDWVLGANLGYYDSSEDGNKLIGEVDNRALYSLFSAGRGNHKFHLGYQQMFGDHGFPRVFANVSPLGNELPTYSFDSAEERSCQARYDYNFVGWNIPGLTSTLRYIKGDNVRVGDSNSGREFERDLDLAYTFQKGSLKNLSIRMRNVTARSSYKTDINENRLIISYTLGLF